MIIVLQRDIRDDDKESLRSFLTDKGFKVREIVGEEETIFGAVGLAGIDAAGLARPDPTGQPAAGSNPGFGPRRRSPRCRGR
mgnify:CR=1 FL=1